MTKTLSNTLRGGLAAAAAAALPFLASAQEAPGSTERQMVVRDAASGQLRAPTAEEAQALRASPQGVVSRRAVATPLAKTHEPSGARGARLTDAFMSYSVLVRQADGTLAEQCFNTREEAEAALKTGAPAPQTNALPTE